LFGTAALKKDRSQMLKRLFVGATAAALFLPGPGVGPDIAQWRAQPTVAAEHDHKDLDVTSARTRWDEGLIEAKAGATADLRLAVNRAQAKSMALKAARHLAYEKLAETVEGLSLTGEVSVWQAALRASSLRTQLQAKIRGAHILSEKVTDLPDGSVWAEVALGLPLAGREGVSGALTGWASVQPPPTYRPNPAYTTEERYTGVIVEASGLGFSPGLTPRLLAEDDRREIYGPSRIAPQALEAQGLIGYADSLLKARGHPRVGPNPLILRAVGVAGDRKGDLLLSRRDAERLLAADRRSQVLSRGAMLIVVGKGPADVLKEGKRYAVLVGVNEYAHAGETPPIRSLRFAASDARDLATLLTQKGGYAAEDLQLLANAEATRAAIDSALRTLRARVREEDTVVFFFSGHGTVGTARDGLSHYYLVPHDGRPSDLDGTAIRDDVLEELIGQLPAKKVVVLLDACHSGGLGEKRAKGFTNPGVRTGPQGRAFMEATEGRVILAASRPEQVSIEDDQLQHGVFTHFLLEALGGPADLNRDGEVTALEAYQYLSARVREYTARTHGFEQRPVLEVRGMSRELIVAAVR